MRPTRPVLNLMSNEVNFGWVTAATLTFSVYTSAGVARQTGTAMTETPASSGLYLGSPTLISVGDNVIVKDSSGVVGHGEYRSEVNVSLIESLDATTQIQSSCDAAITANSDVDAILADTNELQVDWTDGGRLDLILDDIDSHTASTTNVTHLGGGEKIVGGTVVGGTSEDC